MNRTEIKVENQTFQTSGTKKAVFFFLYLQRDWFVICLPFCFFFFFFAEKKFEDFTSVNAKVP